MDWRDIPSLAALRAFEAMGRLGGFSAAARELNVTHAAIAQHVRGLESEFGQELVFRQGPGMALTDAGLRLTVALSEGFGVIASGVRDLRDDADSRPLQVTLTPSFAENWLMPRLGKFWAAHPDIPVALVPSQEVIDLRRDGFDLGLRFGAGDWPGTEVQMLAPAHFVIVGTPDLVRGVPRDDLQALASLPWMKEAGWREQELWASEVGLDMSQLDVTEFPINTMVLSAVRAGLGVALQGRALVENDLASGALVALHETHNTDLGYHIVTRPGAMTGRVKTFVSWLKSVA